MSKNISYYVPVTIFNLDFLAEIVFIGAMETVRELLSRIRWDDEFGRGTFSIGIYERNSDSVEFVPLEELHQEKGNHFSFGLTVDGEEVFVPYHRIREVRKNGKTIWQR